MTMLAPQDLPSEPAREQSCIEGWRPRPYIDLLVAQLSGLDAWYELVARAPVVPAQSSETRLDEARRQAVAARERGSLRRGRDGAT